MEMRRGVCSVLCAALLLAVLTAGNSEEGAPQSLDEDTSMVDRLGESQGDEAQQEGVQLMAGLVSVGAAGNPANEEEVSAQRILQTGKAAMKKFAEAQQHLIKRADKLRSLHDHPPVPAKGISYDYIPGMVMRRKGKLIQQTPRSMCEGNCNSYKTCLSYSYNTQERQCIMSFDSFQYDGGSTFYLKKKTAAGAIILKYEQIPGLKVPDDLAVQGGTFEECKYECSKSEGCSGFAYDAKQKACASTKFDFIEYDDKWDYYEKELEHTRIPKEVTPENELHEAKGLKLLFQRQADRMKKIRSEQTSKMEKQRSSMRSKAMSNEKALKQIQAVQSSITNQYGENQMTKDTVTDALKTSEKMYQKLANSDHVLKEKLATAKQLAESLTNKEAKEKAQIDVTYLSKKLISSRVQAQQLKDDVENKIPQERTAKAKLRSIAAEKDTTDETEHQDFEALDLAEARVDLGSKEKATKAAAAKIEELKMQVEETSQIKPFNERKLEVLKELLLKAKLRKESAVMLQKRVKVTVDRLVDRNKRQLEAEQDLMKEVVSKKNKAHEKAKKKRKAEQEKAVKDAVRKKKEAEAEEKKRMEVVQKEKENRIAKQKADQEAEKEAKALAKEEAVKAQQRQQHEKERQVKVSENAVYVERDTKKKREEAEKDKAEVGQKYTEMKSYEKALEASTKAEEAQREKNKKLKVRQERDTKETKELLFKSQARKMGYEKMKESKEKAETAQAEQEMKEGQEKVRLAKIKKANNQCDAECIKAGKKKASANRPSFMGCYKDGNTTHAMSAVFPAYSVNTIEWCNAKCAKDKPTNRYLGLQDNKCFCSTQDEDFRRYGTAHKDKCILACPGNPDQLCGGPMVNRIYRIQIPPDTYSWKGHVVNESIALSDHNYNFRLDTCQCTGTFIEKASSPKSMEVLESYMSDE